MLKQHFNELYLQNLMKKCFLKLRDQCFERTFISAELCDKFLFKKNLGKKKKIIKTLKNLIKGKACKIA